MIRSSLGNPRSLEYTFPYADVLLRSPAFGIQYRRPIFMQLMRTAFAILALLAAAGSAVAAQEKDLQVSGTAGWNGRVSRGDWTPVRIDLDNRGKKDADLIIAVTWGGSFATQSSPNPTLEGNSFYGRSGPTVQIPVLLPAKSRKRLSVILLTSDV